MKLSTFLILLSAITVFAGNSYSQTKLSLDMKSSTVKEVLRNIEEKSEFVFMYSEKIIDVNREVSVNIKDQKINVVLDNLFAGTNVTYEVKDRFILLTTGGVYGSNLVNQQARTVIGRVTDSSGEPLPGVTVIIKGTTQGTITDFDGNYTISNVPADGTLVFSFVGMRSEEIVVGNQSTINLVMEVDAIGIEEVVAIGYGTVKKSDLTSAISSVKGEQLENRVSTRLDEALQGQLSGVTVQQTSGIPGAAPRILVRGVGSINAGNNPLYVVDGFPVEDASLIANINGSDIESIEVLKDAASAAIYGSRGSNGVVIITTKKGTAGKVSLNFSSYYGIQSPEKRIDFLNTEELGQIETEARNSMWILQGGNINDPNDVRPPNRRIDPEWTSGNYPDYDKQDFLFSNNAPIQNHTISASGGNDRSKYFMSMNYLDQEGITRNTGYERIALRTNLETQVFSDKIKLGLNLNPSRSVYTSNYAEGKDSNTNWILWSGPLVKTDEFYYDYEANQARNDYSQYYNFHPAFTPRFLNIDNVNPVREHIQIVANSYLDIELLEGLNFKTSGGILYGFDKSKTFVGLVPGQGTISRSLSSGIGQNWLWENTLNYSKTIDKHSFNILAGYSIQKAASESFNVAGRGYENELSETLNNATEIYGWGEEASEWSMISMLSRLTYNYDSRYLFTAAVRRDASSRFGKNNRWGTFPSLSAAWNIHKEKFWSVKNEIVSNLKLRLSWGKTGNNRIGNYATIAGVAGYNAILGVGENLTSGFRVTGLGNPDLGWEKTQATNVGLDVGFWNDRLGLTFEYYNNKTTDLLLGVPIPLVTGFTSQIKNIGSVRNSGFEFDLISRNIVKGEFNWTTRLNIFTNKNEVLEMGPEGAPIITGSNASFVSYTGIGHPIGSFYMHRQLGIFQNQAEVDASATVGTQEAGDVKLNDLDGDGDIDGDDREFVGQPQPKYNFGITNELKYKNFDLSIFINGAGGNKIMFSQGRYYDRGYSTLGLGLALLDNWNHRWRSEENPGDGKTPSIVNSITGGPNYEGANGDAPPSTRWLYDADFWRLKNITLGYTLPKNVSQIVGADNLRFYLSGDNLFLKTDYIGFNPQVDGNNNDNYLASNYDYGSIPLARKIVFGFKLTF